MKRYAQASLQSLFVAGLAFGAHSALAGEGYHVVEHPGPMADLSVSAIGSTSAETMAVVEARPGRHFDDVLIEKGLAGHGSFPSNGGPLDE